MLELARRALLDIRAALKLRSVWWALASEDVADSHRRTLLGPIWPLLNYLLFAGTLILILGHGAGPLNFTAFIASGLLVWLFINDALTLSSTLFIREESFIKGTVLPISVYVLRQTMLITIRAFFALLGAVPVILVQRNRGHAGPPLDRARGPAAIGDRACGGHPVRGCRRILSRFSVHRFQRHAPPDVHHAGLLDPCRRWRRARFSLSLEPADALYRYRATAGRGRYRSCSFVGDHRHADFDTVRRRLAGARQVQPPDRVPHLTMVSIRAINLSLSYPLPAGIKLAAGPGAAIGGRFSAIGRGARYVTALDDVSFELKAGDRLGLVGANGAGKTTLLKVLYGIYEPTGGRVETQGRVDALFNINLGFRQRGDRTAQHRAARPDQRLEQPRDRQRAWMRSSSSASSATSSTCRSEAYSQGMAARLAFAIATSFEPEILLMDEWIGAGDPNFQDKAKARMDEIVAKAGIIVLASHNEGLIKRVCNKVLVLEKGKIRSFGS